MKQPRVFYTEYMVSNGIICWYDMTGACLSCTWKLIKRVHDLNEFRDVVTRGALKTHISIAGWHVPAHPNHLIG